jgi:RNA polymerase sigma factor (sigma-70 family)
MKTAILQRLVRQLRQTAGARQLDGSTDAELLQRFQADGDPEAFETIVRRYGASVLSACRKVLSSEADVDDAFQATFLVLLQNGNSIRQRQALGGWLSGVAHRLALKALAQTIRRQRVEHRKRPTAAEGPDVSWREACAILHEELDKLPDTYRLPLILCYLDGKSRDEAAQQLGVKTDVLRGRLERGRDRLRGRLTKRGIALSAGLLAVVATSVTAGGPPEALLRATLEAAATGEISASVATLLRGATPSVTLGKFKLLAAVVLVVGLISGGVGLSMTSAPPVAEPPAQPPAPSTEKAEKEAPEKGKTLDADNKPVAVSGKVIGPDGKPVPRAKLFVFDSMEVKAAPQTDAGADGAFTFELPPLQGGRSYRYLVATAPDLGLGCDWVGVAAATEPLRDAVLKLPKDEPIKGRLVDLEGKPVVGAKIRVTDLETGKDDNINEFVELWPKDKQQAFRTLLSKRLFAKKATAEHFAATTDAKGRFTLAGIGRDRCPQLTISARGRASQVCIVALRPGFKPGPGGLTGSPVFGPEFTLPLAPSVPITGVVRDADKKPLAGVRILGQPDLSDAGLSGYLVVPEVVAITDAEGRYTLDGVAKAKKYVILADPKAGAGPVHLFATRNDDAPGFAEVKADFDLPRGVVLTGQVTDKKTGQPVHAHVFYRPLWSNKWVDEHPGYDSPGIAPWYSHDGGWTDADGQFKLTAIPGPGILHVQVLGHEMEREYVTAKLAPEDNIDEVVDEVFGSRKFFKTRGQGGHFDPGSLNAYRVLRIAADAKTFTADMTVVPGVNRTLKIVDADGKPVSGAWVLNDRVYGDGATKPLTGSECLVTALDPEKPRLVYAQHDGEKLAGFIALDGKETEPAVLKLQATATVTGRVVDKDGEPLKECRVSPSYRDEEIGILLNTRDLYGTSPIFTDSEGRFTMPNIPAGLTVEFDVRTRGGKYLGHVSKPHTLKPGETLDLGDWKPK